MTQTGCQKKWRSPSMSLTQARLMQIKDQVDEFRKLVNIIQKFWRKRLLQGKFDTVILFLLNVVRKEIQSDYFKKDSL